MRRATRREACGARHLLIDADGCVVSTFDLGSSGLDPDVAEALMRAHAASFGHGSIETQRQCFRCLRQFVACMAESGYVSHKPLPPCAAAEFHRWLSQRPLKSSTAESIQNVMTTVLRWCQRNVKGVLAPGLDLMVPAFRRQPPAERPQLSASDLKAILAACYLEIDAVEATMRRGRSLYSGDHGSEEDREFAALIQELITIGNGQLPWRIDIPQRLHGRVKDAGGLLGILGTFFLMHQSMFAFYLAIVVQTSGNPMAIRDISLECIEAHPLLDDREWLVWEKARAGKIQRADFPKSKQYSAVNLVRRLRELNAPLRNNCKRSVADKLFVAIGRNRTATVPCMQLLHIELDEFIERHGLPSFDFKDLRTAGAREQRKARGELADAQFRLNHMSPHSTVQYVNSIEYVHEMERSIRKYQGALVASAQIGTKAEIQSRQHVAERDRDAQVAQTVFGFGCRDPFGGIDGYSQPGKRCLHFTRCAECSGAIVVLDDPNAVARILAAKRELDAAEKSAARDGWLPRFSVLYEPIRTIIVNDIVPFISADVMKLAQGTAVRVSVPKLE